MKKLLLITLLTLPGQATEFDVESFLNRSYLKVGIGYKLNETEIYFTDQGYNDDPISARLELGFEYTENITLGFSHHSQYFTGKPFSEEGEYAKNELFIDYTFRF